MNEIRLIDANALKEELAKNITVWTFNVSYDGILAEIIDNAPTVELNDKSLEIARKSIELGRSVGKLEGKLERPQGEWIATGTEQGAVGMVYTIRKCSNCGFEHSLCIPDNFCPNCGTEMRGANNENEQT